MKPFKIVLFGLTLFWAAMPGAARACWVPISLEEFVKGQPVIIVGEIQRVASAPRSRYAEDTGYISVERILKNTGKKRDIRVGAQVRLSMPAANNELHMSTDISYRKGQRGIWFLYPEKGKYYAGHPMSLQPVSEEPKVLSIIKQQRPKQKPK